MIARRLRVDFDGAFQLGDRILAIAESGKRDPQDVMGVGIARAGPK